MVDRAKGSLRRLALIAAALGVLALAGGAVVGGLGADIDIPGERTYDCGSLFGRLGGDEAETQWAEDTFLFGAGNESLAPEDLPNRACQQATEDRELPVMLLGGLGVVMLIAAVVLFFVSGSRSRDPGERREPGTADEAEPA